MSEWSETIKYINSISDDRWGIPLIEIKSRMGGNYDTIALYVNYLHKAGFLERVGRGFYKRIHDIPSDLSLTRLKNFAYPKGTTWKDKKTRKMIVERYWKLHNIKDRII